MATDVYVLNVGAGSCTVVVPPSQRVSMIDVNDGSDQRSYEPARSEQPLTDPIDWCARTLGISSLFRFVLSHPDADHMAGIRRLLVPGPLSIQNFWDLAHSRTKTDFTNEDAKNDWLVYGAFRDGLQAEGISWPKRITPLRGDSRDFWAQDGFEILSPTSQLVADADEADSYNDASYVIRFRHATSTVLLASDVEEKAWRDMIAAGINLRANVLIASHHGRKSGYSEEAMERIRPEIVVVSTSKLAPKDDAIPDYKRHTSRVFSTRIDGDTKIRMWDDGDLDVYNAAGERLVRLHD